MMILRIVLLQFLFAFGLCFLNPRILSRKLHKLHASSANDDGNEELDSMRRLLESSWDTKTMGVVPADAEACAKEAFSSIQTATERGQDLFFIDLLLPSYDISQGTNLYDAVLAVEYCVALSNSLAGKTTILVRDDQTVKTVRRILDAREEKNQEVGSNDEEESSTSAEVDAVVSSDLDDNQDSELEDDTSEAGKSEEDSLEDFRKQLMSGWDMDLENTSEPSQDKSAPAPSPATPSVPTQSAKKTKQVAKRFRLSSLFGNAMISTGPDMVTDVVEAVRDNAMPTDDEDTIIILSANSREEMIAIRSLVGKYRGEKQIIMFNCKLDPLPRELLTAETVYSCLPLIARAKGPVGATTEQNEPKIVVLRRFPRDWEIYIDVEGKGFEMIGSTSLSLPNKKGPPMSWVTENVQRHLQSRYG